MIVISSVMLVLWQVILLGDGIRCLSHLLSDTKCIWPVNPEPRKSDWLMHFSLSFGLVSSPFFLRVSKWNSFSISDATPFRGTARETTFSGFPFYVQVKLEISSLLMLWRQQIVDVAIKIKAGITHSIYTPHFPFCQSLDHNLRSEAPEAVQPV